MRIIWPLVLVLVLTVSLTPVQANHLVGTDWRLTPLAGNLVRVRLTVYTDPVAGGGNAVGDPSVTIAAYERRTGTGGTDRLVSSYNLPRTDLRLLPGPGPGCSLVSVAVQELTYEAVLSFNLGAFASPNGYYLAWERCCRNQRLTNVTNGQNEPLAATLRFPAFPDPSSGLRPNASPLFGPPPLATAFCLDDPLRVSFAATDADIDSLAYALVPALSGYTSITLPFLAVPNPGPYPLVGYATGFSPTQPLPGTFQLNPRTGELTGVPTQPGTYAVAVAVREFRRGVLIGENRRETELTVAVCPPNTAPRLTRVRPATPPDTVLITGAADRCLTVRATDRDPGQTLTVRAVGAGGTAAVALTPARFTIQYPPVPVDITVCLTDCATPGPRLLTLVVSDDGCRATPPDTLRIPVRVVPTPNAPPILTREPPAPDTLTVAAGSEIVFTVTARDPDGDPIILSLRPNEAPGLSPAETAGVAETRLVVRWTPPCGAGRTTPYSLWLRAADDGCARAADSLRVLVHVLGSAPVQAADLPNIITPNRDGFNDCFGLGSGARSTAGACADAFQEVRIFSRWGRRVYSSADPAFCWDAADVAAGTYFYLVRGAQRTIRGLLTVVR